MFPNRQIREGEFGYEFYMKFVGPFFFPIINGFG